MSHCPIVDGSSLYAFITTFAQWFDCWLNTWL